jgi:hypothetical protein
MKVFTRSAAWTVSLVSIALTPLGLSGQGAEWSFTAQSASPVSLPSWMATDSLRTALSYDAPSQPVSGFLADVNRDGTQDYVLRASLDVCGSNCEYLLIDGLSTRVLGRVGGSVIYVGPTIVNGYPVIHAYGHSSADSGYWSTLVFDGETYVPAGVVYLEGESLGRLFDSLREVPAWPGQGG